MKKSLNNFISVFHVSTWYYLHYAINLKSKERVKEQVFAYIPYMNACKQLQVCRYKDRHC